ncbi:MAG TPA: hypothetical protein VG796_07680 [Verrucomicrobiales bacterium]|nr:hypothetical protein [Verrucomicrobiales bacterium]
MLNLILGGMLWIGICTDVSWRGTLPDILYPFAVACVAALALLKGDKGTLPRARRLYKWACMPSIIGCSITLLSMASVVINPLGLMFRLSEFSSETVIQSAVSPDGTRVADVHFRPVGAYSGGNGRVYVRVHYRWLPFIERDLVYVRRSYADETTHDYLEWRDADTLTFSGDSVPTTQVGFIRLLGVRL